MDTKRQKNGEITKRRLLQNGENKTANVTKRRTLQNGERYKTANVTKQRIYKTVNNTR